MSKLKSGGKLPEIYSLAGYRVPHKILVVGCGGTGGHLIPHLARFISVLREGGTDINLVIADGDGVEKKNLKRQNFIEPDLGKNKAQILARRYSNAFGFEIEAITKDLENMNAINAAIHNIAYGRSAMVIGCVDNNASRKVISEWFHNGDGVGTASGRFWIDSGNEENSGQVVCGFHPNTYVRIDKKAGNISLPNVFELYPDLEQSEDKFNSSLSCAERAQSAPQNMQTNVTAATIIMNFLQKILMLQPINSHAVSFSINNVFSTRLNTPENLSKVAKARRRQGENYYV